MSQRNIKQEVNMLLHNSQLATDAIAFLEGVIAEVRRASVEAAENWEGETAQAIVEPLLFMLDQEANSASTWLEGQKMEGIRNGGIYVDGPNLGEECNRRARLLNHDLQVILAIGKLAELTRDR